MWSWLLRNLGWAGTPVFPTSITSVRAAVERSPWCSFNHHAAALTISDLSVYWTLHFDYKSKVYVAHIHTTAKLKMKIPKQVRRIPEGMCRCAMDKMRPRFGKCLCMHRGHLQDVLEPQMLFCSLQDYILVSTNIDLFLFECFFICPFLCQTLYFYLEPS
jgi:hypothetical protein